MVESVNRIGQFPGVVYIPRRFQVYGVERIVFFIEGYYRLLSVLFPFEPIVALLA